MCWNGSMTGRHKATRPTEQSFREYASPCDTLSLTHFVAMISLGARPFSTHSTIAERTSCVGSSDDGGFRGLWPELPNAAAPGPPWGVSRTPAEWEYCIKCGRAMGTVYQVDGDGFEMGKVETCQRCTYPAMAHPGDHEEPVEVVRVHLRLRLGERLDRFEVPDLPPSG
jgi:hypothetical protein